MKKRDESLDVLKGLACILMILAHCPIFFAGNKGIYGFIGGLAPVLFFAISGVTTTFQTKKSLLPFIVFYMSFAFLGLSYDLIWRPSISLFISCDVPQIVAMSAIIIFLIEKYLHPQKNFYLVGAIGVILLHLLIGNMKGFPFSDFFYNGHIFPLIPWLFVFFVGIYAYRSDSRTNLYLGIISTGLLALYLLINRHIVLHKSYMSFDYVLACSAFLFISFYFNGILKNFLNIKLLRYIGENSFLFLFSHLFMINVFKFLPFNLIYVMWFSVVVCALLLMKVLQVLNSYLEIGFKNIYSWIILAVLIVITPFVFNNPLTIKFVSFVFGFIFSLNYKHLNKMIFSNKILIKQNDVKVA